MEEKTTRSNSYLTFRLGKEEFGVHVSQVLNILEMTSVTAVPRAPYYMKGVINLRGMVLPVVDVRQRFGMEETPYTSSTCIIVMDLEIKGDTVHIGAIVDEVVSVLEIGEAQVEPPPALGDHYTSDFIHGMAKVEEGFIMLLDMHRVFDDRDLASVAESAASTQTTEVN